MATQQIVLPIKGMTCASCVMHVEHSLKDTAGVENAVVNLATERATVKYDPQTATIPDMVWHVQDVGYDVLTDQVELPLKQVRDHAQLVSGEALETAHKINTIILDKTGTLTKGKRRSWMSLWLRRCVSRNWQWQALASNRTVGEWRRTRS